MGIIFTSPPGCTLSRSSLQSAGQSSAKPPLYFLTRGELGGGVGVLWSCSLQSAIWTVYGRVCSARRCQVLNRAFGGAFGGALGRDDEVLAGCCKCMVVL